jgi:subtilisin family serine protease
MIDAGVGVVVAVLDTGTDCTHPDLSANCVPGWNIASSTNDTTDSNGHGTMTAGVVAGVGNNALGVTGTAYGAHVMPIKVTNDPAGLAYTSDIANGIIYATDHGAKVVSNSYAVTDSSMVQSATSYLESKGGVFVCSAGNSGGVLTYTNPSSVVTVGATDKSDVITSWSSYGSSTDISAPGAGIYTTLRGGSYGAVSGTSFSAPMTAGILALEFAINPKLTPQQARTILFSSADDLGAPGFDQYYGYGRINAFKAVNQALATLTSTSSNATSTTKDVTAPSAPSNLVLGSVSSTKVLLSWTASTDTVGVVGYNIMRNGVKIGVVSSTSYTDITVTASSSYTYTVTAFDLAGNISAPSNQIQVVVPASTPVQVKIISSQASVKNSTTAVIKWSTNVPTVVSVAYGTSSAQMTQTVATTLFSTSGSLILPSLTSKTAYSYQITATDAQGIKAIGQIGNFTTRAK